MEGVGTWTSFGGGGSYPGIWGTVVAVFLLGTAAENQTPATSAPQKGAGAPATGPAPAPTQQKKRRTTPTPRQQPAPKDPDRAKTAMAGASAERTQQQPFRLRHLAEPR